MHGHLTDTCFVQTPQARVPPVRQRIAVLQSSRYRGQGAGRLVRRSAPV